MDDEADSLEFLGFVLEQECATVTAVTSAGEALEKIAQQPPDLLISDIGMPSMDGLSLIKQVRSRTSQQERQIKALGLTAYAGKSNIQQIQSSRFSNSFSQTCYINRNHSGNLQPD